MWVELTGRPSQLATITVIAADNAIPNTWKRPAASGGVIRALYDDDYRRGVFGIVNARHEGRLGADATSTELSQFLSSHLTRALNEPANAQAMVEAMLSRKLRSTCASLV